MSNLDAIVKRVWYVPYAYGHTVRVWYAKLYHTHIVHAIHVWYVLYAYGIKYAYGTEHRYSAFPIQQRVQSRVNPWRRRIYTVFTTAETKRFVSRGQKTTDVNTVTLYSATIVLSYSKAAYHR